MKRRARRAPISGRSAPSVRARRAHPGTHPPPSIRPRPLQIPSSRPSVGTQSPEQVGHFRSPEPGQNSRPLTRRWGAGFALPRDASETAPSEAPTGRTGRRSMWGALSGGFRAPRDAGRRPALQRRCWGGFRAAGEAGAPRAGFGPHRENWPALQALSAGFALPRDAGRRPPPNWPALQATPTGCRNSTPYAEKARPVAGVTGSGGCRSPWGSGRFWPGSGDRQVIVSLRR